MTPNGAEGALALFALGLGPTASAEDVEAAFRRELKRAHPDHGGSDLETRALLFARESALAWLEARDQHATGTEAFAADDRPAEGQDALPRGWRRSKRGNPHVELLDGTHVVVISISSGPKRGRWATLVRRDDDAEPSFGPVTYATEAEAVRAVERERRRTCAA